MEYGILNKKSNEIIHDDYAISLPYHMYVFYI